LIDSLTLSDTVGHSLDKNPKVYDTLTFVEHIPATYTLTVLDTLTLSDDGRRAIEAPVANTAIALFGLYWPAGDSLVFNETITVSGLLDLQDSLTFVESADWLGPHYEIVQNYLSFTDTIWHNNTFRETVAELLTLVTQANLIYNLTISDSLAMTDEGMRKLLIEDLLTINETVMGAKGLVASNTLSFTQGIAMEGRYMRSVADALNLGHAVTYFYINPCIDKQYHPFIGESNVVGGITPPSSELSLAQGLPVGVGFQLSYPVDTPTDIVTLRAPEFDGRDRNTFNRVNRETRGGRLVIFADPQWPRINTITCTFTGLLKTEISDIQDFILNHIGEQIEVIDWDGRVWTGVILKPNEPATCDGKNKWSIGFEFEGILKANYTPGLPLEFTQVASTVVLRRPVVTDYMFLVQEASYRLN
jgi:hypothetical protein